MSLSQVLPTEAYQLATRYGLGTPQMRHSRDGKILHILWAVLFAGIGGGVACALLSDLLDPNSVIMTDDLVLIIIIVALIFAAIWFGLALVARWAENLQYCAYECSEGFFELHQAGRRVVLAMRWDDIRRVQMVQRKWRFGTEFYITHREGRVFRIHYFGIWHRCREELRRRPHEDQLQVGS